MVLRNPLLVDLLAVDAVGEALQMGRAVSQRGQHRARRDGAVVLDELPLGAVRSQLREVHLVRVGQPDLDPVDVDFFCCAMPSPDSSTGLQHNVQMDLPVMPPVSPMLAKSVKSIPPDASYEPKWDGFRSILFRDGAQVEVGSRNEKPMTRYFPELVAAAITELPERCVIDGEIVIATDHGLDFEALQQRIHPADSRVRMLAEKTPASFIAFDLLALGDDDFTARPFSERRAALVDALAGSGPSIHVTPATTELTTAQRWFDEFEGAGLDGVIAKPLTITYQPDKRIMFKIKHERTADCVVAGYRVHKSGNDAIGSLLLGLYKDDGTLASVGVIGAFPMAERRRLFAELQPLVTEFR